MTKVTIDIPDAIYDRVVEGFAKKHRYDEFEATRPQPKTKKQFMKDTLITLIKQAVKETEADQARDRAGKEAAEKVEEEINIT